MFAIGTMQRRCNEYEKAIDSFIRAEEFCPARNEHIVGLAETYRTLRLQSMKMQTERLVDPERKMPFPEFILTSLTFILTLVIMASFYTDCLQ